MLIYIHIYIYTYTHIYTYIGFFKEDFLTVCLLRRIIMHVEIALAANTHLGSHFLDLGRLCA